MAEHLEVTGREVEEGKSDEKPTSSSSGFRDDHRIYPQRRSATPMQETQSKEMIHQSILAIWWIWPRSILPEWSKLLISSPRPEWPEWSKLLILLILLILSILLWLKYDFTIQNIGSKKEHKSPYKDQHLFSYPYLEKYIDGNGGELHHKQSGVKLIIPEGALSKGWILSISIIGDPPFTTPWQDKGSPRVTPIVKCEPAGLEFEKEVKLIIPYCSFIKEDDKHDFGTFHGEKKEGKEISWTDATVPEVAVREKHCCLAIMHFSYFFCFKTNMADKIIQVMPFARRIDDTSIKMLLWMCNSDGTSMQEIRREEGQHSSAELQSWQDYMIYNNGKEVGVKFMKEKQVIPFNKMWHGSRTMRKFLITDTSELQASGEDLIIQQLDNEDKIIFTVQLSANGRPLTSPVSSEIAESGAFIKLKQNIQKCMKKDHCANVAMYCNLGPGVIERIETGPPEGVLPSERLLEELIEQTLFGPNNVQPLLEACTFIEHHQVASMILSYRQENEAVESKCATPVPSELEEN